MRSLIQAVALSAALALPVASFAQSNEPVTRAQVKAELVQLEKAGYQPAMGNNIHYPDDIQAAEAKVAATNGETSGYGGVAAGSSEAGQMPMSTQVSGYSPPLYNHR